MAKACPEPGMKENAPLLVRVWLALDRVASAMWRTFVMVRDETLWAGTSNAGRERANRAIYNRRKTYLPGGSTFEGGLFDWEREALAQFPVSGRILLGAAGGGRELAALANLGYEVVAFEPASDLAEAARTVAARFPPSQVITASFHDLLRAAEKQSGPLAPHVCGREIAGVILGWGSFSYVWREDRVATLKALHTLAPHAPVLFSYTETWEEPEGVVRALRVGFRRLLRLSGFSRLAEPGDRFQPWGGFSQTLAPADVQSLAARTGYRAVFVKSSPAAHALFVPLT